MKKTIFKISALLIVFGAFFAGCGGNNNNCNNGQVSYNGNCVQSCTDMTGQQGGIVNGACQSLNAVNSTCMSGYTPISSTGQMLCCPASNPYPSAQCMQPGYGNNGSYPGYPGTGYPGTTGAPISCPMGTQPIPANQLPPTMPSNGTGYHCCSYTGQCVN